MQLQPNEVILQTALWAVDGIGRKTFRRILLALKTFEISLDEFWLQPAAWAKLCQLHGNQVVALQTFVKHFSPHTYWEYLLSKNIYVVHELDERFPANLAILDDRPPVLFVQGQVAFPPRALAVVGTRKITSYGRLVTQKLVKELVAKNCVIVSGFMYGVDALAHETALTHHGQTVAVLGFGFDHMYPAHFETWKTALIAAGQTFVTEYAPHVAPNRGTFPARNRLLAGLSQGVLVTEAAHKSGSHITADWAVEYGRTVYAVPGPITNPYTEGTKALLNQGAHYVQSAEDIADDLGWAAEDQATAQQKLSPVGTLVLAEIQRGSQVLSSLAHHIPETPNTILKELSYLELAGLICKNNHGWTVRKSPS